MTSSIPRSCGKIKKQSNGCPNGRITSEAVVHFDSLVVRQDLCVSSLVGWTEEPSATLQTETTIFEYPVDPVRPLLVLSVIARNVSTNPVDVSIVSGDDVLASATAAPNSDVSLAAPNARQLIAAATAPSRVKFFITVFYPVDPIIPVGSI